PGTGRTFEAVELRNEPDGTHPIVDASTASQVAAVLGRPRVWLGPNLAVKAPGIPGEVIEVLRPDRDGHYDLASIAWLGDRPADRHPTMWASPGKAQTRRRARA